jgi:hypothetical protein
VPDHFGTQTNLSPRLTTVGGVVKGRRPVPSVAVTTTSTGMNRKQFGKELRVLDPEKPTGCPRTILQKATSISMDQWDFLDPWLKTLTYHLVKSPKHPSRDRARRGFTIAPHIWVYWDISDDPSDDHARVKRAMELVAYAIRVDKRVWEKLRVVCYQHDADFDFDWHRFHSEDLELHIEADVSEMIRLDEYFRPLAAAHNDPRPGQLLTRTNRYQGPTSVAAYFEAKRRIRALDAHGRLGGFQIPLTFTIELQDDNATAEAIAMFERLTRSGLVAFRSQTRDDGPQPVYLLEELKIEPRWSSYSSFLFDAGNGVVVPGVLALGPLKEFGILISTVVGRAEDDPALLDWMANDRALNVALVVEWNAELRRVYEACCRGADALLLRQFEFGVGGDGLTRFTTDLSVAPVCGIRLWLH